MRTKYDLYLYPVSDHGDEHIDNKLCSTISCRNDQFGHTNYFCEDLFRVFIFIFLYTHILFARLLVGIRTQCLKLATDMDDKRVGETFLF